MSKKDSMNPGVILRKAISAFGVMALFAGSALILGAVSERRAEARAEQDETDDDFEDEDFFLQKDVLAS